jgi:hypothetical protein
VSSSLQTHPSTSPACLPSAARRTIPVALPRRRPDTVPGLFLAAARLIDRQGHWQGDFIPDPFSRRMTTPDALRPMAIVSAIRCARTGNPRRTEPLAESAIAVLAGRLEVDGEPAWNEEPFHLELHVCAWGDVEGRTAAEVVAVLESAAAAASAGVAA